MDIFLAKLVHKTTECLFAFVALYQTAINNKLFGLCSGFEGV